MDTRASAVTGIRHTTVLYRIASALACAVCIAGLVLFIVAAPEMAFTLSQFGTDLPGLTLIAFEYHATFKSVFRVLVPLLIALLLTHWFVPRRLATVAFWLLFLVMLTSAGLLMLALYLPLFSLSSGV